MDTVTLSKQNRLFWLGRYAERVYTTTQYMMKQYDRLIDGETVEEVLDYVQYNPKKLVRQLEIWVTKSVKQGKISLEEGKEFLSNYRSGLYGYTYLE